MTHILATCILMVAASLPVIAQMGTAKATQNSAAEQKIVELEKRWNSAIQSRDLTQTGQFLADSYFLAIGVQGRPLITVPKAMWLENLKLYKIESYNIDHIQVHVYGDTAVALLLWTQKATVGAKGTDRSGQFVLTDIWVKQKDGWRVAERHSSRPEQPPAPQPKQ